MADRNVVIQGLIELHLAGQGGAQAVASMKQILGEVKQVEAAVGGLGEKGAKSAGTLDAAFGKLGATLAATFAAGRIADFLRDSYVGFARIERQTLAVENQIRSLGGVAGDNGFRKYLEDLTATSGIIDDELVPAFQRALLVFKDYQAAQEILNVATRFQVAGITDVMTAVNALTTVYQTGSVRPLKELGIVTKDTAGETIKFDDALKAVYATLSQQQGSFDDAQRNVELLKSGMDALGDATGRAEQQLVHLITTSKLARDVAEQAILFAFGVNADLAALNEAIDDAKKRDASIFGPEQETDAQRALRVKAEEKARAQKAAGDAEASKKASDLDEQNVQATLKAEMALYEEGAARRLEIELELLERQKAAAIKTARDINADVAKVGAQFDLAAQLSTRRFAALSGSEPSEEVGQQIIAEHKREELEAQRFQERLTEIEEHEAAKRRDIEEQALQWRIDSYSRDGESLSRSVSETGRALADIFGKHKGFAIGMAIMDTSSAIMQVWADSSGGPWYVKLAKTIALAAIGAAQIQKIRSATVHGGGSSGGEAGFSPALAPTDRPGQSGTTTTPQPPATVSDTAASSIVVRAQSGERSVVINIGNAFGDRRAMTKLTREISRVLSNDQSVLR